jgi:uncharacterized OB-fold protein
MAEQPAPRKIPAPQGNPETEPFWAAAREGRLMIGRCVPADQGGCGKAHYYPRSICPFCFTPGATLEEASGKAIIYTVSVTYRGAPEPYAIGYVELQEGPRIMTGFTGAALESFRIGDPVKVMFVPTEEDAPPVPIFAPAQG